MRVSLTALLLLAAVPATAQTAAKPTTPVAAADKKICRHEPSTGSIMPEKRICHTSSEWKQIDAERAAANDNYGSRGGSRPFSFE